MEALNFCNGLSGIEHNVGAFAHRVAHRSNMRSHFCCDAHAVRHWVSQVFSDTEVRCADGVRRVEPGRLR
jgi:hypothetical protein